jgi:hypothetical protein
MPTRLPHKTGQMRRRPYVKSPQKLLRAVAAAFVPITPVQDLEKNSGGQRRTAAGAKPSPNPLCQDEIK